eukprot:UN01541
MKNINVLLSSSSSKIKTKLLIQMLSFLVLGICVPASSITRSISHSLQINCKQRGFCANNGIITNCCAFAAIKSASNNLSFGKTFNSPRTSSGCAIACSVKLPISI